MSEAINFNEVELNENTQQERAPRKTVSPGVHVFDIVEAEVKKNKNDKTYIAIKFENDEGQYHKEQFYITDNATTKKRIKELATNSGVTLGSVTPEEIAALLIGNKVGLVLGGEKENAIIDGREVVVTRAMTKTPYNFSFKVADKDLAKWKNAEIKIEDKTAPAASGLDLPQSASPFGVNNSQEESSDLPF